MIEQMYDTNIKNRPLTYIGKRKKKDEIMVDYLDYGFLDECDDADELDELAPFSSIPSRSGGSGSEKWSGENGVASGGEAGSLARGR